MPLLGPWQDTLLQVHQLDGAPKGKEKPEPKEGKKQGPGVVTGNLTFRSGPFLSISPAARRTQFRESLRWNQTHFVSHSLDWARFANAQTTAGQKIGCSLASAAPCAAQPSCAGSRSSSGSFQSSEVAGSVRGNAGSRPFNPQSIACRRFQWLSH